jgi:hypothetical protein
MVWCTNQGPRYAAARQINRPRGHWKTTTESKKAVVNKILQVEPMKNQNETMYESVTDSADGCCKSN